MPDSNVETINKQQTSYGEARIENLKKTALKEIYFLHKNNTFTFCSRHSLADPLK